MGHRVPLSGARIKGGAQWWVPSGWAQPKDTTRVPIPMGSIPVWKANGVRCKVTWLVARGNRLWQSNLWLWKLALVMWNNVSLAGKEPKLACKVEKSPTTYSSARLYTQLGLSSALPTMRGAKQLWFYLLPPPGPPSPVPVYWDLCQRRWGKATRWVDESCLCWCTKPWFSVDQVTIVASIPKPVSGHR